MASAFKGRGLEPSEGRLLAAAVFEKCLYILLNECPDTQTVFSRKPQGFIECRNFSVCRFTLVLPISLLSFGSCRVKQFYLQGDDNHFCKYKLCISLTIPLV